MYHPRFKGGHYAIGLKFGRMLKKQGVDIDRLIQLNDFQREHGRRSYRILSEIFPEVCDEIRGITDGLDYPHEKFAAWLLCMGCCYDPRGCTTFCFAYNGRVLMGRNNDLPPFLRKDSMSAYYQPENGNAFIGNTSSMVTMEEGLNEHGLAVAMEFIMPTRIVPGVNSVILVRYLLEKCGSTSEAVEALRSLPVSSACSIILADKTGKLGAAECEPGKMILREPAASENFLIAANHFVSGEMRAENSNSMYSSGIRYQTANNALSNISGADVVEYAQEILSGKHGFMCQYDPSLYFETIWSSVFNISNMHIFRAEGDPSKMKYKEDMRAGRLVGK